MTRPLGARSSSRLGLALAVAYAGLAVVYGRAGGNPRPLFDGFAPPPPYRWVHPPKEFAAGNQPPKPSSFDVPIGPAGSAVAGGSSEDGQLILSLAAGVFAAHPPDDKVVVHLTPVDPAALAPPPTGLEADGNGYRLDLTYQPSGEAVAALAAPADVFVVVPDPAQTLLFSADAKTWQNLPPRPVPDPTQIGGAFTSPGYYLAVAPPVGRPSDTSSPPDEAARLLTVAAATLALALALGLAPVAWRKVRR